MTWFRVRRAKMVSKEIWLITLRSRLDKEENRGRKMKRRGAKKTRQDKQFLEKNNKNAYT